MAKGNWIKFKPKKRPKDYEDPPEVLARQFFYLEKWKAQGKVINQPRIAWALARARRWWENQRFNTPEWGDMMWQAKLRAQRSRGGKKTWERHSGNKKRQRVLAEGHAAAVRASRDRGAKRRNPLAIPAQPKKAGKKLAL